MLDMRAPGCYGIATVNNPKAERCLKCVWLKKCTEKSITTLLEIHKELNVSEFLKKYDIDTKPHCTNTKQRAVSGRRKVKKYDLTESQQSLIATLPKKTKKVVEQLFRKGIDLKLEIRSGENPFEIEKPKFLRIPVKLLLDGGFTRPALSLALQREFPHWEETTRRSHEGIIMSTLEALDIIKIERNEYRVKQ